MHPCDGGIENRARSQLHFFDLASDSKTALNLFPVDAAMADDVTILYGVGMALIQNPSTS
jgi:hypothetical protein